MKLRNSQIPICTYGMVKKSAKSPIEAFIHLRLDGIIFDKASSWRYLDAYSTMGAMSPSERGSFPVSTFQQRISSSGFIES